MSTVVLAGASGRVGRRVLDLLLADDSIDEVVTIDDVAVPVADPRLRQVTIDLGDDSVDLTGAFVGADCLVHLAPAEPSLVSRLLGAASAAGVDHALVLSSATVYGAWPNNPVPLTEDAILRPNTDFPYAVKRAAIEHVATLWSAADDARVATVLRPTTALAEHDASWLARALAAAAGLRVGDADPPAQFVHLDDLAAAVDVARRSRYDGPLNVAPDGWVSGEDVRALAGAAPRLRLPGRLARRLAELRWQLRRGPIQPGVLPFASFPWVVANDRLRSLGWVPALTNEEAYVAGTTGSWWSTLSPKRKQELALGGAAAAAGGLALAGALLTRAVVRRHRRHRLGKERV